MISRMQKVFNLQISMTVIHFSTTCAYKLFRPRTRSSIEQILSRMIVNRNVRVSNEALLVNIQQRIEGRHEIIVSSNTALGRGLTV